MRTRRIRASPPATRRIPARLAGVCCALALALASDACTVQTGSIDADEVPEAWQTIEPGLELGRFTMRGDGGTDVTIYLLRCDPAFFELELLNASAGNGALHSVREWSEIAGLVAAINAGMYQQDYSTSISLMRTVDHVNNAHLTRHQSILAFDPIDPADPPVTMIDLECERYEDWKARYASQIQSIRMISCRGENVWEKRSEPWSTAALGIDDQGRPLFVHVRDPVRTRELIDRLIELPLGIKGLMYAEGGAQAQMIVHGAAQTYDFVGRIESMPQSRLAWPVPNVVGIARRASVETR